MKSDTTEELVIQGTILVTGATGNVGRALTTQLASNVGQCGKAP